MMIVILTQNAVLGRGLAALLDALAEDICVTFAKSTAAALAAIVCQEPSLMILNGSIGSDEFSTFFSSRATEALFPPILLLVDSTEQEDLARREQVPAVLKGSVVDFTAAVDTLLFGLHTGGDGGEA